MNIMKRTALFLALIMSIQLLGATVYASATAAGGDGSVNNPYQISTVDELFWFAGIVNGTLTDGSEKNTFACAVLTDDIVINENDLTMTANLADATVWTPIGNETDVYSGVFDGNGKTISGLYVNDGTYRGMFGYTSGKIKNLTLENMYIESSTVRKKYIGGIAGYASGAEITGCSVEGDMLLSASSTSIGAIAGYLANGSVVSECVNNAYINTNGNISGNYMGGIAGSNNASTIKQCDNKNDIRSWGNNARVGGMAGESINNGYVIDCVNNASVSGGQYDYAAGIVCINDASTISGCVNNGNINYGSSGTVLGGIAVENLNGGIVTDCKNTDSFETSSARIAGIVTYLREATVENCCNEGNIKGQYYGNTGGIVSGIGNNAVIRNCYNTGAVTLSGIGLNETETAAGIVWRVGTATGYTIENCFSTDTSVMFGEEMTVTNCYYLDTLETDTNDGTTFKTAEQFASGEVCYLLNGDQSDIVFYQILHSDTIPSFAGEQVYYSEENGYSNKQ